MLFNSLQFLIFFPIVLLIHYLLPPKVRYLWLLAASYYFYMCWNARYALLLLSSTVVTYLSGLLMDRIARNSSEESQKNHKKKWVVAGSFLINLGILFFFKYFNFAADLINSIFSFLHIAWKEPVVDVILPVGISFYTFQALSYTIDVYRGEIYAEKNFFRYSLFVSFFPQLVAGPIERSKNLLKQLAVPQKFDARRAVDGLFLMLWGYFLKLVVAERAALFVDSVYGGISEVSGWMLLVATVLFAVQVYCDFAGYSVIAMGAAEILGIRLMENFNAPYLSTTVAQFWRNWHISLTSWFKDYLYIPLGGNRKGKARKYLNKMIVFLVSGLWHGANLKFVIWGGLNGIYQVIGEMTMPVRNQISRKINVNRQAPWHKFVSGLITFILIDFSWIFFRASSMGDSVQIIRSIFSFSGFADFYNGTILTFGLDSGNIVMMILSVLILLFVDIMKRKGIEIRNVLMSRSWIVTSAALVLGTLFILVFGIWGAGYDASQFIYFQF